jgi:large subunit ribosomal protein L10
MSKNLAQKKELQNNLNNEFIIFLQYHDYTTLELAQFKINIKKYGLTFKIVKASSLQKLLESTQYSALNTTFNGPIAIIYSNSKSSIVDMQECCKFLKRQDKIEIIGAIYDKRILFPSLVNKFADLPSQEELLTKSTSFLQMVSGQNIVQMFGKFLNLPVNTIKNGPNNLTNILNQRINQA